MHRMAITGEHRPRGFADPAAHPGKVKLSIIVVFHNMGREAVRTLHSLSAAYQSDVSADEYDVIAVDNGSEPPLAPQSVHANGPNFRLIRREPTGVSPVDAVNETVSQIDTGAIAVIVDGARMATPGLVATTLRALTLSPMPFVCSLSWHLGPEIQGNSMLKGYDQCMEDRMLADIGWPEDGYRLFEISTLAPSSGVGFLGGIPSECSWFALPTRSFHDIGGFEPRFKSPGGGRMNHDFRDRAVSIEGVVPIVLLGEGVFHQFHGGVTTNVTIADRDRLRQSFWEEYHEIRGVDAKPPEPPEPLYFGGFHPSAKRFIKHRRQ